MGDFYGARLKRLATMQLRIVRRHVKFKTGPAGGAETERKVAGRLRERGQPGDSRAADVVEAYLPTPRAGFSGRRRFAPQRLYQIAPNAASPTEVAAQC